jgi:uncharacterized membrane protein
MNRLLLLGILLASVSSAALIYTVDTDRSGFSSVTLSMQGGGTVQVALPDDASDFRIVGGSYQVINGTAIVNPGSSGFTTFSFTSSLFTSKTTDGWRLAFDPPDGATVDVYMPPYSNIDNPFPTPNSISADSSRTLIEFDKPQLVTVYYRLGQTPAAQPADNSSLFMMIAVALVAVAIISAAVILKMPNRIQTIIQTPAPSGTQGTQPPPASPAKTPTLDMTSGKKEMMETFNENDLKIVDYLISVEGKSRRNELERKTGISKSSLAMAINRLEKRKIIEIDRTSTTHFVKLSDYFLRL